MNILKKLRDKAGGCLCLDIDSSHRTKCTVHDVNCDNIFCNNKCCILECDLFAKGKCKFENPCRYIRKFNPETGEVLHDISDEISSLKK